MKLAFLFESEESCKRSALSVESSFSQCLVMPQILKISIRGSHQWRMLIAVIWRGGGFADRRCLSPSGSFGQSNWAVIPTYCM